MKRKTISVLMLFLFNFVLVQSLFAQRHLYNRLEIGSGNAWTYMTTIMASMLLNSSVDYPLSEATLRMGFPTTEYGNLNTVQGFTDWNSDRFVYYTEEEENTDGVASFALKDLLSNIIIGDKIGYLSDRLGFLNYCIYASAYYNIMQLKLMHNSTDYTRLNTQRFQTGGGLMLIFGSIEKKNRVILDAGLRYNIPGRTRIFPWQPT